MLALLVPPMVSQAPKPFAKIQSKEISESSGLARSTRKKGLYWTHNDSGDRARLFGIRLDGAVTEEHEITGAKNVDWEDIATDGGTIWINDAGNNANRRQDLTLYKVKEGEWRATAFRVAYPDQKEFPPAALRRFDCEGLFVRKGKPYLVTKWRVGGLPGLGAGLYRMDTQHRNKPNVLTKLGERADLEGWVTAAGLSPNGRELALLCHLPVPSLWIFDATPRKGTGGENLLARPIARLRLNAGGSGETDQIESLVWESDRSIVFGNEGGDLFRVRRATFGPI